MLRGMEAPHPFPVPCPVHLFSVTILELHPFMINQSSSKQNVSLSSESHSSKLIKLKEQVVGTSDF